MPRPKKDPDEQRGKPIAFRPTDTERMEIQQKADMADMTLSEYARTQALHGQVLVTQYRRLDPVVFDELKRIGVNLNQLTRLAHVKEKMPYELPKLCADLERFLTRELDGYDPEDRS